MTKFGFIQSEEILNVSIRGKSYPVVKAGKGQPCLMICLGTPSFRTISKNFADMFEVYSSDMYWIKRDALDDPGSVTMNFIIDDIKALGDALGLKKYFIFAHSAYGIIALEFAKKYPNVAAGIIMVGTPLNSNSDVAKQNDVIFHHHADQKRKSIDAERREKIANEDLSKLDPSERWLKEYVYRDAPRYWHIPDFDCTELWNDIFLDKLLMRLFTDILPKTDVLQGLECINEPIFLAAGMSDYDCCPWVWRDVINLPKNFTMRFFNHSGHWPHYEEADLFDQQVKDWLEIIPLQSRSK